MDRDVKVIKSGALAGLHDKNVFMLVEGDDVWQVHHWTPDSVSPVSEYETPREAASRLLQLLHIGPVAPQTHPEVACIGEVDTPNDR